MISQDCSDTDHKFDFHHGVVAGKLEEEAFADLDNLSTVAQLNAHNSAISENVNN